MRSNTIIKDGKVYAVGDKVVDERVYNEYHDRQSTWSSLAECQLWFDEWDKITAKFRRFFAERRVAK